MTETLPPPQLEHLCDLAVTIAPPIEVGQTPLGLRRAIPITGGVVKGPRLNGRVLAGGADFQLILGGGTQAQLDARYVIELDDGSRVYVQNTALRCAALRWRTRSASCAASRWTRPRSISAASPGWRRLRRNGPG